MVRSRLTFLAALSAAALLTLPAAAQSVDPLVLPEPAAQEAASRAAQAALPPPLRLGSELAQGPLHRLRAAEVGARDSLDAMLAWNAAGKRPVKGGFARPLPLAFEVRLGAGAAGRAAGKYAGGYLAPAAPGWIAWGTHVEVAGAHRLRLHLSDVRLPAGTRMWVYGRGEAPLAFGLDLVSPDGGLWTPSVGGEALMLEIQTPAADAEARFSVREVMEIFGAASEGRVPISGADSASCFIDGACAGSSDLGFIDTFRRAVVQLQFTDNVFTYLCSGALINDTASSATPYMLTANHCLPDQTLTSTLEAFFAYVNASCHAAFPSESTFPRTNGATLLATGAAPDKSDYSLVQLHGTVPPGSVFLGWNANPAALGAGTPLYRLSHPVIGRQVYSQVFSKTLALTTLPAGTADCQAAAPPPNFIYSQSSRGGTAGGSSGSPEILANGQLVGQLLGQCLSVLSDNCDPANLTIDGAFARSYPALAPWLGSGTSSATPCLPDATTLCLSGGRFKVTATFDTGSASGQAHVVPLTGDTGYLWFFGASNVEAVVKVLNGCGLGGRYWVFAGGLTNVKVVITVTDSQTGVAQIYVNPLNTAFAPIQDTNAFATCP